MQFLKANQHCIFQNRTFREGADKKEFEPTFVKPDSIKLKMMST